ncbi:MAG: sporulation integral membrane protein YlbJ [Firmicutes bacterium]|jgi:sporulation integral membrane protein YlbJ|nr:sporulation integral membrane protein YlbJ [Bacillota bacterium]HOB21323.1 sporulation integral membrane protein YlbJ [Bacillota bacterium]HQD39398.1 sporulation integral membrane protein YlbJ [Bacillota bacterium]
MNKWLSGQKRKAYFTAAVAAAFTVAMVLYPEQAFRSSLSGLKVWWEIVFPALLPFFIAAELLMGLGVVHAMGALLEPLMRPLFGVPGVGAFALAMGLASGYPIGAKISGRLRKENLCTKVEGERLVAFTNTADPLFLIGAVAVGMFHSPALGGAIAGAHYLSAILVGLMLRFYGRGEPSFTKEENKENLFRKAARELYRARLADGRPFGQLFGDAVRESINSLLFVGGCIMMFSVVIEVLTLSGFIGWASRGFGAVLSLFGLEPGIVEPLISGLFEITIGCEVASKANIPLFQQVMAVNAIIAWSGLSVLSQVATMVNDTDLSLLPYIGTRIVQAVLAALLTFVFLDPAQTVTAPVQVQSSVSLMAKLGQASLLLLFVVLLLLLGGILLGFFGRKIVFFSVRKDAKP